MKTLELLHELRCNNSCSSIDSNLHTTDLFVDILHKLLNIHKLSKRCIYRFEYTWHHLNNEVHCHLFQTSMSDQKTDIITLMTSTTAAKLLLAQYHTQDYWCTDTAFLRMTMNCSARCIRNRVNLWHKFSSISSACLILIETRTELMDGSIRQYSFSVRETYTLFNNSSLFRLQERKERY